MKTSRRGLFGLFAGVAAAPVVKKVADALPVDLPPPVEPPPIPVTTGADLNKVLETLRTVWDGDCSACCYDCGDQGCVECAPSAYDRRFVRVRVPGDPDEQVFHIPESEAKRLGLEPIKGIFDD